MTPHDSTAAARERTVNTGLIARLGESIETLLADYLRRSIVRSESDVPLSMVMRDLRALLDSASS